MKHPFDYGSQQTGAWLFFITMILVLVISLVLGHLGRSLSNDVAKKGMFSLQFAATAKKSQQIVASWDAAARKRALASLAIDFLFIFAYVATMSFACLMASRFFDGRGWSVLSWVALVLASCQLVAGLFDAVENGSLIYIIRLVDNKQAIPSLWPALAAICAGLKFTLLGVGGACVLTAVVCSLAPKLGSP